MKNKVKIYFIYEREMASVEGMRLAFKGLINEKEADLRFKKNISIRRKDINDADILLMIRPHNFLSQKIAELGKKTGCFVIFFMDDDMFDLPTDLHSIPWRIKALRKTLAVSDIILTPNPYICKKYKDKTCQKRGVVIDTPVSEEDIDKIPDRREENSIVKLVYAAGEQHSKSINKYILPVLEQLNKKYKHKISMTFIGVKPEFDLKKFDFPVKYIRPMMLENYRKWMNSQQYDIGFAPLDDIPFNNKKYFNKFFEYTLAGVVGIYSSCKPYTFVIKNEVNGFLADNTEDDWIRKTFLAVDNNVLRQQCVLNAKRQLSTQFIESAIRDMIKKELPELAQKKYIKKQCKYLMLPYIIYRINLVFESVYLMLFYLKKEGLKKTLLRIVNHMEVVWIYRQGKDKNV